MRCFVPRSPTTSLNPSDTTESFARLIVVGGEETMKNEHKLKIFIGAAALALSAASVDAATIYLKDGSQLKGTVVGATARDVDLYTQDGTLHISTDRILRVDY